MNSITEKPQIIHNQEDMDSYLLGLSDRVASNYLMTPSQPNQYNDESILFTPLCNGYLLVEKIRRLISSWIKNFMATYYPPNPDITKPQFAVKSLSKTPTFFDYYIETKSFSRCLTLAIPILGIATVKCYDALSNTTPIFEQALGRCADDLLRKDHKTIILNHVFYSDSPLGGNRGGLLPKMVQQGFEKENPMLQDIDFIIELQKKTRSLLFTEKMLSKIDSPEQWASLIQSLPPIFPFTEDYFPDFLQNEVRPLLKNAKFLIGIANTFHQLTDPDSGLFRGYKKEELESSLKEGLQNPEDLFSFIEKMDDPFAFFDIPENIKWVKQLLHENAINRNNFDENKAEYISLGGSLAGKIKGHPGQFFRFFIETMLTEETFNSPETIRSFCFSLVEELQKNGIEDFRIFQELSNYYDKKESNLRLQTNLANLQGIICNLMNRFIKKNI